MLKWLRKIYYIAWHSTKNKPINPISMKHILSFLLLVLCIACKQESTPENAKEALPENSSNQPVKITKKDYVATVNDGVFTKEDLVSITTESFNDDSLIEEVTITIKNETAEDDVTVYAYKPKLVSNNKIELYNDSDELIEIEIHKDNTLYSYEVAHPEEPTLVRKYDKNGNHLMELSVSGNYLYVTDYQIKSFDENGFATSANATWTQYIKPNDIDYYQLDLSGAKAVTKDFHVVDFTYEFYQ